MQRQLTPQTLRRLTYFAAIADTGSIREAARRLGLSVASVSESLADLEEELGVTLANRTTRQLTLTAEGLRVRHIAEQMLETGETLFAHASDLTDISGHVALTAPVEVAQSWLPPILESFLSAHPGVTLSLSAGDDIVELAQSPFDLAIRGRFVPPGQPAPDGTSLPLTCVSARRHQLTPTEDGWRVAETLLSHRKVDHLAAWDSAARAATKLSFSGTLQVDNKHVALAIAARGMGAALVTRQSADAYADLIGMPSHLSFGAIKLDFVLRDKRPSRAARTLYSHLTSPA